MRGKEGRVKLARDVSSYFFWVMIEMKWGKKFVCVGVGGGGV